MDPIDTLMEEHRRIEEVLAALARYGRALAAGEAHDREELLRYVEFFRDFADTAHHGKEERILFTALAEHGLPAGAGPIAVMLSEHEEGRSHVRRLAEIGGGTGPLRPEERARAASLAGSFAALLGAHIRKEDEVPYPMSRQVLPPDAWPRIRARFETYESENAARHAEIRKPGAELAARPPA